MGNNCMRKPKKILALIVWFFFPFLTIISTAKLLTSRYFIPFLPFLILSASLGAKNFFKQRSSFIAFWGPRLVVFFLVLNTLVIILYPKVFFLELGKVKWFSADRFQYVTGSASGYGVTQAIEFIKNKAKDKKL